MSEATRTSVGTARIGFLGVGWIGRHRMEAVASSGAAEAAAIVDPSPNACAAATAAVPGAVVHADYREMLEAGLDGIVIATPSGGHAEQAIAALHGGHAVFCQKPLGRTSREVEAVVDAASRADRYLAVDLSYRFVEAARAVRSLVRSRALGRIYAADLTFHNAYGPDKDWFYDAARSGGGCVMDLGVHLIDLLLWTLDFPRVLRVGARLFAEGRPLRDRGGPVEDYAEARVDLAGDVSARLACSWKLHAGKDAHVDAVFHGTSGSARVRNVGGSFYDFVAEWRIGTARRVLVEPPDAWGGRAAVAWARRIARGDVAFDPACRELVAVAEALDAVYGSAVADGEITLDAGEAA